MIVRSFFLSSKRLKFFLLKKWSLTEWVFSDSDISIGHFQPISVQEKKLMHTIRETSKTPKCWCIQASKRDCLMSFLLRWSCCDWVNQPIVNYSVQQFLHSSILLWM